MGDLSIASWRLLEINSSSWEAIKALFKLKEEEELIGESRRSLEALSSANSRQDYHFVDGFVLVKLVDHILNLLIGLNMEFFEIETLESRFI